jgi:hypothetical protein
MAKCKVQLNNIQVILLKCEIGISDFAFKLHDYYQGRSANGAPDIKELVNYINDDIIPNYFGDNFKPQDAVDFLDTAFQSGVVNGNALSEALCEMFGSIASSNPHGISNPDYIKKSSLVIDLVERMAQDRFFEERK